jgi:outer membrane autotransporter protein
VSALASYSHFGNSTTRTISGVGPGETENGSFDSNELGARLEVGRTWTFNNIGVTPFAAFEPAVLWQPGYAETSTAAGGGPGVFGLTYMPMTVWSLPTFLGAQIDTRLVFSNGMVWQPYARVAWVHEFSPARNVTALFDSLPAGAFTVEGARATSDSAQVNLGSKLALSNYVALLAGVTGEFSDRGISYAGTGALQVSF